MHTCHHCGKTDSKVTKLSQASLGYSDKPMYWKKSIQAESDKAFLYHPSCFAIVDKIAELELFGAA